MTEEFNPYAPPAPIPEDPEPPAEVGPSTGVWREDGKVVVAKEGGQLPDRCVVCNRPAHVRLKKTFSWHPSAYYFLFFLGWCFYFLALLYVRKMATVELGLCDRHHRRSKNGLIIGGVGFVSSFLFLMIASSQDLVAGIYASLAGMVIAVLAGRRLARVAVPAKIDAKHLWLRAGAPFVASLPTSPDGPAAPPTPRSFADR